MIHCATHKRKHGTPYLYQGRTTNNKYPDKYKYICPVAGCEKQSFNGKEIENYVKKQIRFLLAMKPDEFYKSVVNKDSIVEIIETRRNELKGIEDRLAKHITKLASLENDRYDGRFEGSEGEQVYNQLKLRYKHEKEGAEIRKQELEAEIKELNERKIDIKAFEEIRQEFFNKLSRPDMSAEDWIKLFNILNAKVFVRTEDERRKWIADRILHTD